MVGYGRAVVASVARVHRTTPALAPVGQQMGGNARCQREARQSLPRRRGSWHPCRCPPAPRWTGSGGWGKLGPFGRAPYPEGGRVSALVVLVAAGLAAGSGPEKVSAEADGFD